MRHAPLSACLLFAVAACTPDEPPATPAPAASTAAVTATPAAGHQATYTCGDLAVAVRFDNSADTAVLTVDVLGRRMVHVLEGENDGQI